MNEEVIDVDSSPSRLNPAVIPIRRIATRIDSRELSRLERKYELENQYKWNLCCSKSSPALIKYLVSVFFATSIMFFSVIQISRGVENPEIYFNMISFIVGIFLKSPSIKK
jgi:hypothetical protein